MEIIWQRKESSMEIIWQRKEYTLESCREEKKFSFWNCLFLEKEISQVGKENFSFFGTVEQLFSLDLPKFMTYDV